MAKNEVYKQVTFNEKILFQLVNATNQSLESLTSKGYILEKLYLTYYYKRTCNLCKLSSWPEIHRRLYDVLGRPVFRSCDTLTKLVSKFLDYSLIPVMQNCFSYIKDSKCFLE